MGLEKSPRVLIADDDSAMRYILSSTLSHQGFHVLEARSGQEAIDRFSASPVDVILMDVEMPGTDGYQACSEIRANTKGGDIPIIMVTGNDDSESVDRAYQVGATDFISKPINWSLIGHRLRYILRSARNLKALGVSEAENCALLAAIPDRIFVVDSAGEILTHLSGFDAPDSDQDLVGRQLENVFPAGFEDTVKRCLKSVLESRKSSTIEYPLPHEDIDTRWLESRFVYHGERRVLVINRDISERKFAETKIHSLAYFDALTRLPNRPLFNDEFDQLLKRGKGVCVFPVGGRYRPRPVQTNQ